MYPPPPPPAKQTQKCLPSPRHLCAWEAAPWSCHRPAWRCCAPQSLSTVPSLHCRACQTPSPLAEACRMTDFPPSRSCQSAPPTENTIYSQTPSPLAEACRTTAVPASRSCRSAPPTEDATYSPSHHYMATFQVAVPVVDHAAALHMLVIVQCTNRRRRQTLVSSSMTKQHSDSWPTMSHHHNAAKLLKWHLNSIHNTYNPAHHYNAAKYVK